MVLKGNKIQIGSSRQCMITKLWFLLLITIFSFINGQVISHDLPLWQKDYSGIKEVRIFKDGELAAIRQFRQDGKTAFQFVSKVNSATEHRVDYWRKEGGMHYVVTVSSTIGFGISRLKDDKKVIKLYYNKGSNYNSMDVGKDIFFKEVKNIKDSTTLFNHRKIRTLTNKQPELVLLTHRDENGRETKSYHYRNGKLVGTSILTGENNVRKMLNSTDGSPIGISYEYEGGLMVSSKTRHSESFFGYNKDKKLVSHTTYRRGKLQYVTSNRYDGEKLVHRKFENLDARKEIEYTFNYDEKGKVSSIVKQDGKKTATFNYEYSYW